MNEARSDQYQGMRSPEKSVSRVTINGAMMGSLFFILTLIWTLGPEKFNIFIIGQLVLAIPLLFISSLAYAKIGYRDKWHWFNRFGWITTTLGNNFILNVAGLMAGKFYRELAYVYFSLVIVLVTVYYLINILHGKESLKEELAKLAIVILIVILGGILPLILM